MTSIIPQPMIHITGDAVIDGRSRYYGKTEFQNVRLGLEHEEVALFDQMIRGENAGNVMVVVSPIPDAVVNDPDSIEGYRTDLMRSLVRIYYILPDGRPRCRMLSIDRSNPEILMALARQLNLPIASWAGSEDMLSRRGIFSMDSVDDIAIAQLAEHVIDTADSAMLAMTGEPLYAGSKFSSVEDALTMVKRYPWLLEECRVKVRIIEASGLSDVDKKARREEQIKRTTGAIHAAIDGHAVSSSSDGVAGGYVANNNYDQDCPTGPSALENTLATSTDKEVSMTCPYCGLTTKGDPCAFRLACSNCDAEVRGGKLYNKGIGRAAALARRANKETFGHTVQSQGSEKKPKNDILSNETIKRQFGHNAIVKSETVIGGKERLVVDKKTNQVYAKL